MNPIKLSESSIGALVQWSDPIGILSLYVGFPTERSSDRPTWPLEIRNQLRALARDLKTSLSHREWTRVAARFAELEPELDALLDSKQGGRGRALIAAMSDRRLETFSIQLALPTRVSFDKIACLRPMITALDEGRTAGAASIHLDGVHVFEWRLEETEKLKSYTFTLAQPDWREMRGPAAPNPLRGQETVSHTESFERRVEANRQRTLKSTARDLGELLAKRAWERIVIFGDPRVSRPFAEMLPEKWEGFQVLFDDRVIDEYEHAEDIVRAGMAATLRRAQRAREALLVRRAKDMALSRSRACLGLRDTLDALNQSRVEHLLVASTFSCSGFRTIDGQIFKEDDKLARQAGLQLLPEGDLVEHMLKRALATNAKITPIEAQAARDLEAYEGVGAILRW